MHLPGNIIISLERELIIVLPAVANYLNLILSLNQDVDGLVFMSKVKTPISSFVRMPVLV